MALWRPTLKYAGGAHRGLKRMRNHAAYSIPAWPFLVQLVEVCAGVVDA